MLSNVMVQARIAEIMGVARPGRHQRLDPVRRSALSIQAYISNGMNATEAYKAAYPRSSEKSARSNATRLMENDGIRAGRRVGRGAHLVTGPLRITEGVRYDNAEVTVRCT